MSDGSRRDPEAVSSEAVSSMAVGSGGTQKDALKAPETTREQRDEEEASGSKNATTTAKQELKQMDDASLRDATSKDEGDEAKEETELGDGATKAQVVADEAVTAGTQEREAATDMAQQAKANRENQKERAQKSIFSAFCGFVAGLFFLPIIIPLCKCAKRMLCPCLSHGAGKLQGNSSEEPKESEKKSRLEIFGNVVGIVAAIVTIVATCATLIPEDPGLEVVYSIDQGDATPNNSEPVDFNVLIKRADTKQLVRGLGISSFNLYGIAEDSFTICKTEGCFQPNALYKFKMIPAYPNKWEDERHEGLFTVSTRFGDHSFFFHFTVEPKKGTDHPSQAPSVSPSAMPSRQVIPGIVGSSAPPPKLNCSDSPCFPGVICTDDAGGGFSCGDCPPDHDGNGVSCKRFRERFDQPMSVEAGTDDPHRIWAHPSFAELINLKAFCSENGYNHIEDFQEECIEDMDSDYLDWIFRENIWRIREIEVTAACSEVFSSITCLDKDFTLPRCSSSPCFPGASCSDLPQGGFECGTCPSNYEGDGMNCVQFRETFDHPTARISNDSLPLRIWADSLDAKWLNTFGFCWFEKGYDEVERFDIACDGQAGSSYLDWNNYDDIWETRSINITNETLGSCYDLFQSITCINHPPPASNIISVGTSDESTSINIIVGPVVGAAAVIVLVLAVFIHRIRRQRANRWLEDEPDEFTGVAQDSGIEYEEDELEDITGVAQDTGIGYTEGKPKNITDVAQDSGLEYIT